MLVDDYVVVREQAVVENGEMCVARIEGDATVNYFRRTGPDAWTLEAVNDNFEAIMPEESSDVGILGKVVSVIRRLP